MKTMSQVARVADCPETLDEARLLLDQQDRELKALRRDTLPTLYKEIDQWKLVASHLATCHAATLEGWPKSASKAERRRLVLICENAAKFLRGQDMPTRYGNQSLAEQLESEIKRCEVAVAKYKEAV